mgnify:CR=1 FL=1
MNWNWMLAQLPLYAQAAKLTLALGLLGTALALVTGVLCAAAQYLRIPVLRRLAAGYIELSRNTPLLIQLFFLYYGLPKLGLRLSPAVCGVLGLGFLGGSYMAESFRSGLESIEPIQTESALSLGLTRGQTVRCIILPQAVRRLIPLSINLVTRMIKTTSLVLMIGVVEMLKVAQQIIEANRNTSPNAAFGVYLVVFILYFLACWPISCLARRLEQKWR